jgi:Holliday junction resolvase
MTERALVKDLLKALNATQGCHAFKVHGAGYGQNGQPDIIGTFNGRTFAIECKSARGKPTLLQLLRLSLWQAAGARVGIARTKKEGLAIALSDDPQPLIRPHVASI